MKILSLIGATTIAITLAASPAMANKWKRHHSHHRAMNSHAYYPAPGYDPQRGPYPGRALNEYHNNYDNGYMYYARRAGSRGMY